MRGLAAKPTSGANQLPGPACMSLPQTQRGQCPPLVALTPFLAILRTNLPAALNAMTYAQLGKLLAFYGEPVAGNTEARRKRLKIFIGQFV